MADDLILDAGRNVFAIPIYSPKEEVTGVIDFDEITDKLYNLES